MPDKKMKFDDKNLNEDQLRTKIIERAAKVAFFNYDYETKDFYLSDYWFDMTGSPQIIQGLYEFYISHVHQDDLNTIEEIFSNDIECIEYQCDFRFFNEKLGKYIWLRKTAYVIQNEENGNQKKLVGIDQDIVVQKHMINENYKMFEVIELGLRKIGIELWHYDKITNRIVFKSDKRYTYTDTNEISLDQYLQLVHKDDQAEFKNVINKMNSDRNESVNLKYRRRTTEDNYVWITTYGKAVDYNEIGIPIRYVGISEDITEQIENEQELHENQERLRQAQQIAHLGDWEYRCSTSLIYLSDEALRILELEQKYRVTTLDFLMTLAMNEDLEKITDIKYVIETNQRYEYEFFANVKSGQKKLHIIATSHYSKKSQSYNILGTIQDITERNQLEEKLRQSEKMTAIGQLAGGIAHDFNNILMAISGYTELLLSKTNDHHMERYCEKIMQSVKNSAELTKKLLAFSRKDSLVKKDIHFHECVNNALEILSVSVDKMIQFHLRFKAYNDMIFADQSELQNVIMNLYLNSRDAMPNGGHIYIVTENIKIDSENMYLEEFILTEGEYIKIEFIDTGCGMELQILKKVFEPFFTTKDIGKGTGLGLSAIYGTIVSHNGAITIKSEVNIGTTFTILFPTCN